MTFEAIKNELDGQIVDITSSKGDKVLVTLEEYDEVKNESKSQTISYSIPYAYRNPYFTTSPSACKSYN
ncbi:hypothetical protein [Bacillus sp. JJ1764]|uniref:hypothetical protein n=1 Tax=Bacillus sp. JJ1764 TaxID=3122964 RepID=UPI002FFE0835